MALTKLLKRISNKFDKNNLNKTVIDIEHVSGLTDRASEAISGERESLLTKTLSAGAKAALAAGSFASMIAPEITGVVAATAFVGASLYKLYKDSIQKETLKAMAGDGLVPCGKAISNGMSTKIQNVLIQKQQSAKRD